MQLQRSAYAVLGDYQAFERFRSMNSIGKATAWSRAREDALRESLTNELGEKFKVLQTLTLAMDRQPVPEVNLLDTIMGKENDHAERAAT